MTEITTEIANISQITREPCYLQNLTQKEQTTELCILACNLDPSAVIHVKDVMLRAMINLTLEIRQC